MIKLGVVFLDHMLKQVGMGERMRGWLMWCVMFESILVLVMTLTLSPLLFTKVLGKVIPYHPFSSE